VKRLLWTAVLIGSRLWAADSFFESTEHKFDLIQREAVPPGRSVSFTAPELSGWARIKIPMLLPQGVRQPQIEFGSGTAEGHALIDFVKLRRAKGADPGWLEGKLLEGERPVDVSLRVESANGQCTVYVTRVAISGIGVSGSFLDFLIKGFFLPLYPDAKIGTPFDLAFHIDRIELRPDAARVVIRPPAYRARR